MTKSSTFHNAASSSSKLLDSQKVLDKRKILIIFLILFSLTTFSIYWLKFGFEIVSLRESLYLFTSFFATVASIFAFYKFGIKNERAITFLCLTAGMGYWFLGELLFNYHQYILNIDPFPSVADVFYIFAYPYFLIGLLNEIKISRVNWHKIHKLTVFLFGLIAILLVLVVWYFGIYSAYNSSETLLTNTIAISYGVGDLFIILISMLLLVLAWEFKGGKLSKVWIIMFFSFVSTLVADILFTFYSSQYESLDGFYKSLLDSFWMLGYLLFALALFEFGFSIQDIYLKIRNFNKNVSAENKDVGKIKEDFISSVSHELRTPMSAVKGLVSMMLKGDYGPVPEKFKQPLINISVSAERQIHLINDLLTSSRLKAGRMKFYLSNFPPSKLVEQVIESFQQKASYKRLMLNFSQECKDLIQADDIWVKQILENLIGNAIKFTEQGSVNVSCDQQGELVLITISDTGVGLSLSDQKQLFSKFQFNKPVLNKTVGSGLGLYIAREVALKLGGDVRLEKSEPGKGSVFSLSLPKAGSVLAREVKMRLEKDSMLAFNSNMGT